MSEARSARGFGREIRPKSGDSNFAPWLSSEFTETNREMVEFNRTMRYGKVRRCVIITEAEYRRLKANQK